MTASRPTLCIRSMNEILPRSDGQADLPARSRDSLIEGFSSAIFSS